MSEGKIYDIDGIPGYCAKIFYESRISVTLFQKIMAMVANPPDAGLIQCREKYGSVVLAWPVSLLFDSPLGSRNFIGYTMPLVDTDLFREAHILFDPQDRIGEYDGAFSWRYLLTAAYNIAAVTDDIHRHGHCVADFSGSNILIARTAAVAITDCDSFQIRDSTSGRVFPSVVGTREYLPPELQGHNFADGGVDRYHGDLFGLAVMIFKFLMDGLHPFQEGGEGFPAFLGIEQNIQNGVFAFASPDWNIFPPSFASDYHIIPPSIRVLFSRCFVDGIAKPKCRPSAGEWKDCLISEIMAMKHCRANANHWFGSHLAACPWCRRRNEGQFPSEVSYLIHEVTGETAGAVGGAPHEDIHVLSSVPLSSCSPLSGVSSLAVTPDIHSIIPESSAYDESVPDVGAEAAPDSALAILLPESHVAMHDVARNITIPCRLPVIVIGEGSLLLHVTADVPWIEIAKTAVPVEGEGAVHVTLNTGNMSSKGFQNGRVMLRVGDICEEIFMFVSVLPEL